MKILYSHLKFYLPKLKASPVEVGQVLTAMGFMLASLEKVRIGGKVDFVLDLEVRQNRPDCLGLWGIVREVAASFGLPLPVFGQVFATSTLRNLQVQIKAASAVRRLAVVEIAQLNNAKESPAWLKNTVEALGMNSVSLLVDLSNYAMLMTGYPNHLFDAGKILGGLRWELSSKNQALTTLDGSVLQLSKNKELVVSDSMGPLVLASAVGGKRSAVSSMTTSVLAEVAVYDPVKMRADARGLGVATEASSRLEKDLSPELVRMALNFLINLLVEHAGGKVVSSIFEYKPKTYSKEKWIEMNLDAPERFGGVVVSGSESEKFLKNLGFKVRIKKQKLQALSPAWRMDVEESVDLIEEILRMKGFGKIIPTSPAFVTVGDITHPKIKFAHRTALFLEAIGCDEVLTLPVTTSEWNTAANVFLDQEVGLSNAVNEELPMLRQSLISGLVQQQHKLLLNSLDHIALFEIGRVFGKLKKRYFEYDVLGMLLHQKQPVFGLQEKLESLLRFFGATQVDYLSWTGKCPALANPNALWQVCVGGKTVGVLYELAPQRLTGNKIVGDTAAVELRLDELVSVLEKPSKIHAAIELTQKLVVLDANIELDDPGLWPAKQKELSGSLGKNHLWSLEVKDSFVLGGGRFRYTVRVTYLGLGDAEAKALHSKVFASAS